MRYGRDVLRRELYARIGAAAHVLDAVFGHQPPRHRILVVAVAPPELNELNGRVAFCVGGAIP